ncbi:MAG TPA: hypothetical protein VGD08_21470 [Stellaceae bacterium]|jgi:hypothetical protein
MPDEIEAISCTPPLIDTLSKRPPVSLMHMEAEFVPTCIAAALVRKHGLRAPIVAAQEADRCRTRGEIAKMHLWTTVGALAGAAVEGNDALDYRPATVR